MGCRKYPPDGSANWPRSSTIRNRINWFFDQNGVRLRVRAFAGLDWVEQAASKFDAALRLGPHDPLILLM